MPPARSVNDDAVRFGAIINRLRTAREWTLEDLARVSGKNATYLGMLERGRNMPTLATIFHLADVFGVDAADLVAEVEQARRQARAVEPRHLSSS
jgi:transcriptional regulator with XRE-family HTH domain